MNKTIKRIIAREGLIILGIITINCLLIYLPSMFSQYPNNYKIDVPFAFSEEQFKSLRDKGYSFEQIVEINKTINASNHKLRVIMKFKNGEESIIKFDTDDPEEIKKVTERDWKDICQKAGKDYSLLEKKILIADTVPLNLKVNTLGDIGFMGLILSYPFYLLFRFILWSIKTLRRDVNH